MQVLKFGGTSVATAENIQQVTGIVRSVLEKDNCIVVVSALGGITDLLLDAAAAAAAGDESFRETLKLIEQRHIETVKQLLPVTQQSQALSLVKTTCNEIEDITNGIYLLEELTGKTRDRIASYGELLSSQLIAAKFNTDGLRAAWKDSRELIRTDSSFTAAEVDADVSRKNITDYFGQGDYSLYVIPGFVASDPNGTTTTLGRGGSDFTAAIIASALPADKLEIWTDVSGMMTADPRLTANARVIPSISYQEAMELSHFGAKVIYPPTIQPVMNKGIPVRIRNTFAPDDPGTLIEAQAVQNGNIVRGISSIGHIALISLEGSGMVGIPGFSKRLFEALSREKINVILITQSSSEHTICVGIDESGIEQARQAINTEFAGEIALNKVEPLKTERELTIIALVGDKMKSHPGISGRMFSALGRNGVNVRAIAQGSSEKIYRP